VVLGLTIDNTLVVRSLAATSADSNAVDDITLRDKLKMRSKEIFYILCNLYLLGLVAELVSLVRAGGVRHLLDLVSLAVLPSSAMEMK
jgi:hypothetical protein